MSYSSFWYRVDETKIVNTNVSGTMEFRLSYLIVRCELALDNWKILGNCSRNNHTR